MKKIIKNEDLKNVNGGGSSPKTGVAKCPNCDSEDYDVVRDGCSVEYVCKKCGRHF